jgi:CHASE3 domain sensor protein
MTTLTTEEIVEIATKVYGECDWHESALHHLEAFAKLVEDKVRQEIIEKNAPVIQKVNEHIKELQDAVKAEREACANICDPQEAHDDPLTAWKIAQAIRARGNT